MVECKTRWFKVGELLEIRPFNVDEKNDLFKTVDRNGSFPRVENWPFLQFIWYFKGYPHLNSPYYNNYLKPF